MEWEASFIRIKVGRYTEVSKHYPFLPLPWISVAMAPSSISPFIHTGKMNEECPSSIFLQNYLETGREVRFSSRNCSAI